MVKNTIIIRCQLDNELADKFIEIKKDLGLKRSTEVFRYLVKHYHLKPEEAEEET